MSMHSAPKSHGGKKGMGKGDFMKMQQPQMQTVLRVNTQCHCEGCVSKIRSILKKTEGVESCKIDLEQGKVTVIGEVDQVKLIEKLSKKTDKQVEIWGFPKAMNMNNLNNQMKNLHVSGGESGKGGKGNMKPQKKGGDDREMMNFQQMFNGKGGMGGDFKIPPQFKDMKMMMPSKDPKSVKFQMPDHDDDESDDEYDDDESFDESDDEDHRDHSHGVKKKSSGEGKKGFSLSSVPILNRWGSKKEDKSKKEGKSEGGNKKGGGKKGGDEFQNQKQGGGKKNGKKGGDILEMVKNGQGKAKGGNNGGGNNNANNWTVKGQQKGGGGGGGGGQAMNNMQHKLHDMDVNQLGANVARNPGQMGQMGNYQMGGNYPTAHPGQMGQMGNYPTGHPGQMGRNMGQMGNHPMGQMGQMGNYPMGGRMGNFQSTDGGVPIPGIPGMAPQNYNPYSNQQQQQQYMAMMMNQRQQQQQQQQAYGNGMYNNNAMMYGRPTNYGPPPTPPHAMDNHFTQYFNDENPNSCSIM